MKLNCIRYTLLTFFVIFSLLFISGCAAVDNDKVSYEEVKQLIDSLSDEVSLDDEQKILYIKDLYNNLSYIDQQKVKNIDRLYSLEVKLNDLKAADAIISKIKALPENITLAHKNLVVSAKDAYNALTNSQKELVHNYAKLVAAEEAIIELENIKRDQILAKKVEDLINNLPTVDKVTLSDMNYVENARIAYDNLTDNQKKYVSNLNELVSVEKKINELRETANNASDQEKARVIEIMIDSLPTSLTLEEKVIIQLAKMYYEELTEEQKKYVNNHNKLIDALNYLVMLEQAKEVIDLINELPEEITLADEDLILNARNKYDALSIEVQSLITNYNILLEKEAKLNELKS